jgi:integrase
MAYLKVVSRNGGPAFVVRWREHGQEKQRTFRSKQAAKDAKSEIEHQLRKNAKTEGMTRSSVTVGEVVEAMLPAAKLSLKPRAFDTLRQIYVSRILPKWGKAKLSALTSAEIERWVLEMSVTEGLSPSRVTNVFNALSRLFGYAIQHKYVAANPCKGLKLPKRQDNDRVRFMTPTQLESVADFLDSQEPYGLLTRFAAATGLRAAELMGLRVRDLDLLHKRVYVRQTLQCINGHWTVDTPKSKRSRREVPILSKTLLAELQAHLEQDRPVRGDRTDMGLVFPGRNQGGFFCYGRPMRSGRFRDHHFRPAMVRVGLLGQVLQQENGTWLGVCWETDDDGERVPFHEIKKFTAEAVRHVATHARGGFTLHDLRHTAASTWLAAGVDIFLVSRWLGHGTVTITDQVYSHLVPGNAYEAEAERVEAWISKMASSG